MRKGVPTAKHAATVATTSWCRAARRASVCSQRSAHAHLGQARIDVSGEGGQAHGGGGCQQHRSGAVRDDGAAASNDGADMMRRREEAALVGLW